MCLIIWLWPPSFRGWGLLLLYLPLLPIMDLWGVGSLSQASRSWMSRFCFRATSTHLCCAMGCLPAECGLVLNKYNRLSPSGKLIISQCLYVIKKPKITTALPNGLESIWFAVPGRTSSQVSRFLSGITILSSVAFFFWCNVEDNQACLSYTLLPFFAF